MVGDRSDLSEPGDAGPSLAVQVLRMMAVGVVTGAAILSVIRWRSSMLPRPAGTSPQTTVDSRPAPPVVAAPRTEPSGSVVVTPPPEPPAPEALPPASNSDEPAPPPSARRLPGKPPAPRSSAPRKDFVPSQI